MTTAEPRSVRFFLSHSMKDQAVVELLRQQIETLGVDLYLAEHDPRPGTPLADKVIEQIHQCEAMVVLLTEAGATAPFVQQEIGVARGSSKLIVPIVQQGINGNMLAMLTGMERIEVDFARPAEALAVVTSSLEPLVRAQLERLAAAQAAKAAPASTAAAPAGSMAVPVLAGLGILMLALLLVYSYSKTS
jgi:TIR domain